jgi:hypothetical protein
VNSSLPHLIRPRHIQIDLFLGLTETVALISNRFNGLAQITPGLTARSGSRTAARGTSILEAGDKMRKNRNQSADASAMALLNRARQFYKMAENSFVERATLRHALFQSYFHAAELALKAYLKLTARSVPDIICRNCMKRLGSSG